MNQHKIVLKFSREIFGSSRNLQFVQFQVREKQTFPSAKFLGGTNDCAWKRELHLLVNKLRICCTNIKVDICSVFLDKSLFLVKWYMITSPLSSCVLAFVSERSLLV